MTDTATKTFPAPTPDTTIEEGDRVRSFDFPSYFPTAGVSGLDLDGERACYVEGVVEEITHPNDEPLVLLIDGEERSIYYGDCCRYAIRVTRVVRQGVDIDLSSQGVPRWVFPPVNGTATWTRDATFGVEKMGDTLGTDVLDAIAEEGVRYRKAERRADAIAEQIARLTDTLRAAQEHARLALDYALTRVEGADRSIEDEADDAFHEAFGFYHSEVR